MKLETLDTIKARCTLEGDCWLWPASAKPHAKPRTPAVRHNGKTVAVRRLARELADGRPIPHKLEAVARCANLRCVSPECSMKVSTKRSRQIQIERGHLVNAASMAKRAATLSATSKFSEVVIEQARTAQGSTRKVAAELGMHHTYVHYLRQGKARQAHRNPFAGLLLRPSHQSTT